MTTAVVDEKPVATEQTPEQIAAAAAAAQATKTPEQLVAEQKATTDAEIARQVADRLKPPDVYALTPAKDSPLTPEHVTAVAAEAKALGLTTEQATKFLQIEHDRLTAETQTRAGYLADLKADPELGGTHFDTTITRAKAGLVWLFGEHAKLARDWFDETGNGNHKAFVGALARVGKALEEDKPLNGTTTQTTVPRSAADVLFGTPAKA